MTSKFRLVFYAPLSAVASCKIAVFTTGAGRYPEPGKYSECCWTVVGTGQFRPEDSAKPNIGDVGQLTEVEEARVEVACFSEDVARKAEEALKRYAILALNYELQSFSPCLGRR